jgi:hypothetical protein
MANSIAESIGGGLEWFRYSRTLQAI